MRILILVPGGIGEQILFFPTLEDLTQQYPKASVDVLVEPRAKSAYRVCPSIHEVLLFDYRDRNGLADYLNLLGVIRDREYEIAISAESSWAIEMLLWLNGIPVRVGYQNATSWFLSNPVARKTEQYTPWMYHDLLKGLDIHSSCPPLHITLPKADINWAETEQQRLGVKDSGYILLHQGATIHYPLDQWQKIIDDIQAKQPNIPILLLQTAENTQWIAQMRQERANLMVIIPSDVGKLAAIIAGANLMLTTEEDASLHLSVAVGTYTVALCRSSDTVKLLPPTQDRYIAISSPTANLGDITPETVLKELWRE